MTIRTPGEMWDRFQRYLSDKEPTGKADKDGNLPLHQNLIGSHAKHKALFVEANTEPKEESGPKLKPYCPTCGSGNVFKDATVVWDTEKGEWVLSGIFDDVQCDHCEDYKIRNLDWKEHP